MYLDFHDTIELPGRGTVQLWDEMNPNRKRGEPLPEPPAFASKFFDEFSGKQQTLNSFFAKPAKNGSAPPPSASPQPIASTSKSKSKGLPSASPQPSTSTTIKPTRSTSSQELENLSKKGKGKAKEEEPVEKKKGQQSLQNFFRPPPEPERPAKKRKKSTTPSTASSSTTSTKRKKAKSTTPEPLNTSQPTPSPSTLYDARPEDDDIIFDDSHNAPTSSAGAPSTGSPSSPLLTAEVNAQAASAWSNVFAQKAVPLCEGHKEPTKMWTVNKPGINKGRKFYLCQR